MSRIGHRPAAAVLVVAASTGLSACSGGSNTPPSSASSTTTSTTPSSTSTTTSITPSSSTPSYDGPAGVPTAARAHTDAGRIAFAKYYVQQINETGKHPKVGVLEPLALSTCKSCAAFADSVKQLQRKGNRYTTDTFAVNHTQIPGQDQSITELVCSQYEVKEVDRTGRVVNTTAAVRKFGLVFYLEWQRAWRVSEIQNDMSLGS